MANRVNAASSEPVSTVKGEPCKETDADNQSQEVDRRTVNSVASVDCTSVSKVSPRQEGNGDGKPVKPGTGATGKGGKLPDNEVFIPAPPPATNAWVKRMQASASAAKTEVECGAIDDKQSTARSTAESIKHASTKKQSQNPTPADFSAKSDPQSSRLRLEGSAQVESTTLAAPTGGKQPSVQDTEHTTSTKQVTEVRPKAGSEVSKPEVQVKTTSPVSDTAAAGCWKKPAAAAPVHSVSEGSFAQGSSTKQQQHSADLSAGELFSICEISYSSYYSIVPTLWQPGRYP